MKDPIRLPQVAIFCGALLIPSGWGPAVARAAGHSAEAHAGVSQYDVTWSTPSLDARGAMPTGNGDVGLNAWIDPTGDLIFYVSKTDAYDDNDRLLKLARVRISLSPALFSNDQPFAQRLALGTSEIEISAGASDSKTTMRVWVDAHRPIVHVEVDSRRAFELRARLEVWRSEDRALAKDELAHSDPLRRDGDPGAGPATIQRADTVRTDQRNRVVWYHHNRTSVFAATMTLQGLGGIGHTDPLLHRIFGGALVGPGLETVDALTLKSSRASAHQSLDVHVLTQHPSTPDSWLAGLDRNIAQAATISRTAARAAHVDFWRGFWNRSWLRVSGPPAAPLAGEPPLSTFALAQGYALQRYLMACGGRGNEWVKFNGSIFTVPWEKDPDFRRWGGAQWFQNARLTYWPLLASGDFDLLNPFFRT